MKKVADATIRTSHATQHKIIRFLVYFVAFDFRINPNWISSKKNPVRCDSAKFCPDNPGFYKLNPCKFSFIVGMVSEQKNRGVKTPLF